MKRETVTIIIDKDEQSDINRVRFRNYKGFKEQFNQFQEAINRKLDFDDITIDVYDKMVIYFNKKNYSPNTIGRHVKSLKAIIVDSKRSRLALLTHKLTGKNSNQ
ncbi:MAG: phage integrase SAM-like domain-containing protein [Bacteroidales bacterium]|nr:phage integrase SAM-like domain-containing protein [Bacteroidales bacterium]